MQYNPALDGVRALAVILVVAFHTIFSFVPGGMIGVDVFFVLSGYLITTILRNELQASGDLDLKRFYLRRAARLTPPLVLCMVGTYIGYKLFAPDIDIGPDVIVALLYLSDYGVAFWGIPEHITHTWSLSVEEHFYLIWPVFLILTRGVSDRSMLGLLILMFVAATGWRIADAMIWSDWDRTYYRFDTRLSGMILGSILAVGRWRVSDEVAGRMGKFALFSLAFFAIVLRWSYMPSLMFGTLAIELATAALIIALTSGHRTAVAGAMSHPWLVYLGVLSYSIYLWHFGIAYVLREAIAPAPAFAITLAASIAIAALSHRFVEQPVKAWVNRTRFAGEEKAPSSTAPARMAI